MISLKVFIIFLSIISFSLFLFKNTSDEASWFESINNQKIYISPEDSPTFLQSISKAENSLNKTTKKKQTEFNNFEEFPKEKLNFCLNNKSPKHLTKREILDEFIAGPCSPILILPGILGTKLSVQINCQILKAKNPEIFNNCGWSTCSYWWSLLQYKKPQSEYILWVPKLGTPMSFFNFKTKKSKCFGGLVELNFNKSNEKANERYQSHEGINVTWYGNTPLTKKKANVGKNP